ncbi:MAG: Holliday junction branch migration protein RuvA [Alphaproteobacteria bacterium]|nr:Holliday junction branch migration protein RuvA [Alphaproteobacteria bacterium]
MIARLSGRLVELGEGQVVLEVGGVGYLVFCSARTLARLGRVGEAAQLGIETHVREDHIHLYGFAEPAERQCFVLLQAVQGVGAKLALGILGALAPAELAAAVARQDAGSLRRAPGVGPKLAARIVAELKGRALPVVPAPAPSAAPAPPADALGDDAVSALVNLGYRQGEAALAVDAARRKLGERIDLAGLIRGGLRELSA